MILITVNTEVLDQIAQKPFFKDLSQSISFESAVLAGLQFDSLDELKAAADILALANELLVGSNLVQSVQLPSDYLKVMRSMINA